RICDDVIGVERTDQRSTAVLAHVPCQNLQQLTLTPRKQSVQRLIQYSVIETSLKGRFSGGLQTAYSFALRRTLAIETFSERIRKPSFFNLANSAFKL